MLLVLSAVALFTAEVHGAEVIVVVVFLSRTLGYIQEYLTNKAAERLRSLVYLGLTQIIKMFLVRRYGFDWSCDFY